MKAGWKIFATVALAAAGSACAKGAADMLADLAEEQGGSGQQLGASDAGVAGSGGTGTGGMAGMAGSGGPDAGPTGDPCTQGDTEVCTCADTGTDGMRLCIYDPKSPVGGFFGDCTGCAAADPCADGAIGGEETDVDCGGPDCTGCALDEKCVATTDCAEGTCQAGTCKEAAGGTGGTGGSGGTGGTGGTSGTGGTGGTGGAPPPPPPPPMTCTTNPSLCTGLLACCKADGTCGTGIAPLCL